MAAEMFITTDQVEMAVREFYSSAVGQSAAHEWLTCAQVSRQAWNFCWDLMSPSRPPELQFFGASTLHLKMSKFWHELPASQYSDLRKKLLECIINYISGPKIVLTRLCVTLSSYVIHTITEYWNKAVSDIINAFQPQNVPNVSHTNLAAITLEFLTVLPEEFQCMTLVQSHRAVVRNELRSCLPQILAYLQHMFMHTEYAELHNPAIKCFSSWIQFGIPLPECEPLLPFILEAAANEELGEIALEALATVACHQDVHRYPASVHRLMVQILSLENLLAQYLHVRDMDRCYSIYYLVTNFGETHCRLILESFLQDGEYRDHALRIVRLILQCTNAPGQYPTEESCSGLVFNFWYMFQDEITSAETNKQAVYRSFCTPVYVSLVEVLLMKIMLPADNDYDNWNSDDKEQFRCYRQDIQDTLMYCYKFLREPMLEILHRHLLVAVQKAGEDVSAWKMLEACLVGFEAVAESVALGECCYLPRVFDALPVMPFANVKVVSSALSLIGAYAEWLNLHPSQLGHIVPLLLMGLRTREVAPAATVALREISRDCQLSMRPYAEQILNESQRVLSSGMLNPSEKIRLMCTIGRLLSILEVKATMAYLTELLNPYLHEMQMYTHQKAGPNAPPKVLVTMQMLSMLFINLDTKMRDSDNADSDENQANARLLLSAVKTDRTQPVLLILQNIMAIIRTVALTWCEDTAVIETICELFKKAMSTLLDDCSPLLPDMLNLMVTLHRMKPQVSTLDLTKQLLQLFGKDEMHIPILRITFQHMMDTTLTLFGQGIAEHTDIIQAFLQLLSQVLKKNASFMLNGDLDLDTLFQCGIVALSLQETPVVKAASSFIVNFITQSKESQVMTNIVTSHGERLVEQILRCIGGEGPRGVMDSMSDMLLILNKKYFEKLCQWMNVFLDREGFPSSHANRAQKEHYTRLILKERANKRKLHETVAEFTLVCRGILGTEYANQTMPYF